MRSVLAAAATTDAATADATAAAPAAAPAAAFASAAFAAFAAASAAAARFRRRHDSVIRSHWLVGAQLAQRLGMARSIPSWKQRRNFWKLLRKHDNRLWDRRNSVIRLFQHIFINRLYYDLHAKLHHLQRNAIYPDLHCK